MPLNGMYYTTPRELNNSASGQSAVRNRKFCGQQQLTIYN
jgi:hypothetical protein